ncbi:MAG: biotin transporter BioY [Clostridiales bacterium]|jgi:biotin transport system substrate-specific component|nr:biotin transporter BioY [Clostridiales bacterium]
MKTKYLVTSALMAALTAAGSLIKIPTPLAPITLQVFFMLASGMLLGKRYGALSQLLYALMGLLGFPIFSTGGGIGYTLTPTFGFILGFIAASYLVGRISEKGTTFIRLMTACLSGLAVMYLVAIPYMTLILNFYLKKGFRFGHILKIGMLIYLPGDILKCFLCAVLGVKLTRLSSGVFKKNN